jgi:S-formylglutathione hydrolase
MRSHGGPKLPLLVDQGSKDNFLSQLHPAALETAAKDVGYPLQMRMQEGYDHSYFFISTFIDDHIEFHANELLK